MLVINTIHTNWRDERQCKAHDFLILGGKQQSKHILTANLQPDIPMNW